MNRLAEHQQELYELRFSPMCKPAAEVANLTQLEGHHVRARTMIMWRIAAGHLSWGPREVEILYQSTLDSISEAFDIFHYPISRYMLDARADVWEAGLVPKNIENVVEKNSNTLPVPPKKVTGGSLLLAGEINQINTGSARRLNNDHCISFDGKMLGISSNNEQGSTVYILLLSRCPA